MKNNTLNLLTDSNSDTLSANLYLKDTDCVKKWRNCQGEATGTCKKVNLEPMSEDLNTKFCINAEKCLNYNNHTFNNGSNNNYTFDNVSNYNYGYFNDILLLIIIFIIFQSLCYNRPMWTM